MASSSSLLSEEQFLCPICLEVFNRPVSTPCGHNFCMSCISTHWATTPVIQCPICKETYDRRPDLKVNTFISGLTSQLVSLQVTDTPIWSSDQQQAGGDGTVLCDICTDNQQEAVKSCLECLTSYCNTHLEPHHRAAGLKRHTLVNPVVRLEDRICKEHARLLIMFCRDDSALLCDVCSRSRHASHNVVPVQRAYTEMKELVEEAESNAQQMIQQRTEKVGALKESVQQSQTETNAVVANGMLELTALMSEIQKSQGELSKVMGEKQKAAEEEAGRFISSMEKEIFDLQMAANKLKVLKQTDDQFGFLHSFPKTPLLPHTMDLSTFSFNRLVEIYRIRNSLSNSMSQLQRLLSEMSAEINRLPDTLNDAALRRAQQYEVDVTLDPYTAHPLLLISEDRKQVWYSMGSGLWANQILNPSMFTEHLAVLGQRGFSRRFYFEVFVGGKTEWCLGVATASIQRKGSLFRSAGCGLWAIWFLVDKFETYSAPNVPIHLGKAERVGVFVDYDKEQISFYDVQTATLIHSFTDCLFIEELYPYFNPCDNEYGSNLGPMIIVPVGLPE